METLVELQARNDALKLSQQANTNANASTAVSSQPSRSHQRCADPND